MQEIGRRQAFGTNSGGVVRTQDRPLQQEGGSDSVYHEIHEGRRDSTRVMGDLGGNRGNYRARRKKMGARRRPGVHCGSKAPNRPKNSRKGPRHAGAAESLKSLGRSCTRFSLDARFVIARCLGSVRKTTRGCAEADVAHTAQALAQHRVRGRRPEDSCAKRGAGRGMGRASSKLLCARKGLRVGHRLR